VHVVEPGEHLWKIAGEALTAGGLPAGSPAEVAPYWLDVVEANRPSIASGDPDRIRPGERVSLPPLPGATP
jgi:nucleoid-associated protein YgaU